MNKILIFCLSALFLLVSCGKDRSGEYYELTEKNTWVYNEMKDKYLWGDYLQEPAWKQFFGSTTSFFQTLTRSVGQNDQWSYCLPDSEAIDPHSRGYFNHLDSYGMDFVSMNDPTGSTSRSLARVLMVVKGSPAYECGVRRNDFIGYVDGEKVTSTLLSQKLVKGGGHKLEIYHLGTSEEEFVWLDTVEVKMPASRYVEENAFPVDSCFEEERTGSRIAYLQCARLVECPDEKLVESHAYIDRLDEIMSRFKSFEPSELVLDLRLCNYGTPEVAARLASYIVPAENLGDVFCSTAWNSRYKGNDTQYIYDSMLSSCNLQLQHVYVITGPYTQGAPEWLIHALTVEMGEENVCVVGERTKGQGVMTRLTSVGQGHSLYPAVAWVKDANDEHMKLPILPDTIVNEQSHLYLYEYGNPQEPLLNAAIEIMRKR